MTTPETALEYVLDLGRRLSATQLHLVRLRAEHNELTVKFNRAVHELGLVKGLDGTALKKFIHEWQEGA